MDKILHPRWVSEHRGWEDACSALFGLLILLSPIVAETSTLIAVNAGLFGLVIVALAMLEIMSLRRWEEVLEFVCGGWMMIAPFAFQYGGDLRVLHLLLGGGVMLLALFELWQDRNRKLDS